MEQFVAALVLLVIASGVNILAKKFKLPYTILLFVVWIALIPLSQFLPIIGDFSLTPDLLFYVFLPILIFESAYNIKYELLYKNRVTIWSLATIWLIISAVWIGIWLHFFLWIVWVEIPFMITLLFGIIISATDPVAVLALFKDLWTPKRLSLIFEWESLFNDGTAVALFLIIIEVIRAWVLNGKVVWIWILQFLIMVLGWIWLGVLLWIIFSRWIKLIKNNESVEIMLTMLLAHFTFILAEMISHHVIIGGFDLKISGVIATAYAAIIMWNYWRTKISPKVENYMGRFWNFFAFLANSLIFLLMWLIIKNISIPIGEAWLPVVSAIVLVTVMRIISVYLPVGVLNIFLCKKKKVPRKWQHLMAWWDLRWVVGLTLALMIPSDLHVMWRNLAYSPKEYILLLVISVIVFSLLFKWLTIKSFINKLWLNRLKTLEIFEQHETEILIYDRILKKIEKMKKDFHTSKENYDTLHKEYLWKFKESQLSMYSFLKKRKKPEKLIKKAIALHALWVEKEYLQQMFTYNEIEEHLYLHWMAKIERQIWRVESGQQQIKWTWKRTESNSMLRLFYKSYDYEKMSEHDLYIIFRTKFIITGKVLKQLDFLAQIDFSYDPLLIAEVRKLYAHFHNNANEQIELLKKNNPDFISQLNEKLLNKWLMKSEEKILNDLYHKEMITHKLYKKFMQETEVEIMERC